MNYKGYQGNIEFDDQAEIFHGEVIGLRDVVTFQGRSVDELRQAFAESIHDYLDFCASRGDEPDKPYSGKFLLLLEPDLHRKLAAISRAEGTSLIGWVESRLTRLIQEAG